MWETYMGSHPKCRGGLPKEEAYMGNRPKLGSGSYGDIACGKR